MDKKLLIRVYRALPPSNDEVEIGTAYPIARDRVLTARHVLADNGGNIDTRRLELTWFNHLLPNGNRVRSKAGKVKWDGREAGWDAAILETKFPSDTSLPQNLLDGREPGPGEDWESAGFAQTGQRKDERQPQALRGKTLRRVGDDKAFQLGVDYAAKYAEGWKGLSGAAVFVQGRILGLITDAVPPYGGGRIEAIPMFRLMRIPEFRDAALLPPLGAKALINPQVCSRAIARLLNENPEVLYRLEEISRDEEFKDTPIGRPSASGDLDERVKHLTDKLLADFSQAKRLVQLAIWSCNGAKDRPRKEILNEIFCRFLPVRYDPQGSEEVFAAYEAGRPLIDARAVSIPAAELRMAALGNRPATFDKDQTRGLVGKKQIVDIPPLPLEATAQEHHLKHLDMLIMEKGLSVVRYDSKNIDVHINSLLKIDRKNPDGVPYVIFRLDGNEIYRTFDEIERSANIIKNRYPNIVILLISNNEEIVAREVEHLVWFWNELMKE